MNKIAIAGFFAVAAFVAAPSAAHAQTASPSPSPSPTRTPDAYPSVGEGEVNIITHPSGQFCGEFEVLFGNRTSDTYYAEVKKENEDSSMKVELPPNMAIPVVLDLEEDENLDEVFVRVNEGPNPDVYIDWVSYAVNTDCHAPESTPDVSLSPTPSDVSTPTPSATQNPSEGLAETHSPTPTATQSADDSSPLPVTGKDLFWLIGGAAGLTVAGGGAWYLSRRM